MPIIAKDSGGNFTPAPPGTFRAVCVDVIDNGMQPGFNPGTEAHKITIVWQLEDKDPDTDQRYQVRKRYTLSLNEKSALSGDLESWFSKSFTPEQRQGGFDVENVVGRNCMISIKHKITNDGKTFANVTAIMGAPKGVDPLKPEGYVRVKDREAVQS